MQEPVETMFNWVQSTHSGRPIWFAKVLAGQVWQTDWPVPWLKVPALQSVQVWALNLELTVPS